ncbi:MAG: alpha-L-rhamnosidase N-terminal domain-containing protein [Chloroflexota bacterium]
MNDTANGTANDTVNNIFTDQAYWISTDNPFDIHEVYYRFRSPLDWHLADKPAQAMLYLTADSRYKLWINGQFVARGPARCHPQSQSVDPLDVTAYLNEGANTIAIQVYQPGYSHFAYLHRGMAGMWAHLICDGESVLVSDTSWRTKLDSSFAQVVPRVSIYGTGVEDRNMTLVDDWTSVTYDDTEWASARIVASVNGYPWTDMKLRELPLLVEREHPLTLIADCYYDGWNRHDELGIHERFSKGWSDGRPFAGLPIGYEVDEEGWVSIPLASNEMAYFVYDLGRDYTFQVQIEVENGVESLCKWLYVSYAEKFRDGELVLSDPNNYCRVRLTDRFQLNDNSTQQRLEPFAMRGGRYLIIAVAGIVYPRIRFRPHVTVAEYPLEITHTLTADDPKLNKIITLCEDTFMACLQDGFVDSTWRESSQWLGDGLPQALILSSMSDDTRPIKRMIEMAAKAAYPDGILPSILPGEVHAYAVVDYNFTWVELLALYFELTEDRTFLYAMWPTLVKMLDRFDEDVNQDDLLISQPGRRLFLDWSSLSRNEPSAVYNLRYLLALHTATWLASEVNDDMESVWAYRAEQSQIAIHKAFWHKGRWYDDLTQTSYSQQAAALAILTDATREDSAYIPKIADDIVARSLESDYPLNSEVQPDKMVLASPFMHHYIFDALRNLGRNEDIIAIIRHRWGRWVEKGYPTTWENWNVDFPDGSQCHAFSAHPRYYLWKIFGDS